MAGAGPGPGMAGMARAEPPRYLHGVIRFLLTLAIVGALIVVGATVKLGKRTFFGHVAAIWKTDEAQDMKEGIEETAGPAVKKLERGIKAGYREATRDDGDAGPGGDAG